MPATFGLAVENFTSAEKTPQIEQLLTTARRAEQLGFTSLWAWDHLFLGSRQPFPQLEALTTLAVLASHTSTIELGTGILVLPIRDPALLAKTAATIQTISQGRLRLGLAAGWYEREFDATGIAVQGSRPDLRAQPRDLHEPLDPGRGHRHVGRPVVPPGQDAAPAPAAPAGPHRRVRRPGAAPGRRPSATAG